jgi:hypothetical protein
MAAPVTTGKLCTATDQMIVGDIIKCVYEAPTANVAGYFTQFGKLEPTMKVTTIRKNGVDDPNPETTVAYEPYPELPTTPGTTASGFFYLLKVDDGLLVADRMVQSQISWEAINKKNYVYGGIVDAANTASEKIITITTESRPTADGDVAGSTTTTTTNDFDGPSRTVTTVNITTSIATEPIEGSEETNSVTTIVTTETTTMYSIAQNSEE